MRNIAVAVAAAALLISGPVLAQGHSGGHGATHSTPAAAPTIGAATAEYQAANARMHQDMNIPYTGDADVDFARGMVPHHQGAIDMARIVLRHGTDPQMKKLAEEIIAAQEKEIAFIQDWLKKKGQ